MGSMVERYEGENLLGFFLEILDTRKGIAHVMKIANTLTIINISVEL